MALTAELSAIWITALLACLGAQLGGKLLCSLVFRTDTTSSLTDLCFCFHRNQSSLPVRPLPTRSAHNGEPRCHLPRRRRPAQVPQQLLPSVWLQPRPAPRAGHQPHGVLVQSVLQRTGGAAAQPDPLLRPAGGESPRLFKIKECAVFSVVKTDSLLST